MIDVEIIIGERSRALSRNKSKNHVKFRCSVMTFDHATEKGPLLPTRTALEVYVHLRRSSDECSALSVRGQKASFWRALNFIHRAPIALR